MSSTRAIAHNTIIQMVGKIFSTLLGVVALGLLTRYLGTEQFGWYTSTIAFLQFIGIITDFGMTPVTAQMLSEPKYDKPYLFRNLIGFRLSTTIVAFAIAPAIAMFLPYPRPVLAAITFSTISFIAIALNQVFLGYNQTKLQIHIQAIGEFVGRLFLVISLWLLIRGGEGFLPLMGAVTLASVLFTLVVLGSVRKQTSIMPAYNGEIWRAIIRKSWPISFSIICNVVYLKGDIVLMQWFVPQREIGIYGAAYRVLDVVTQSGMMMMGLLLPLLTFAWSRRETGLFKRRYQQSFDLLMLFALPFTVGGIMLARPIMMLVAGREFAGSGIILAILSLAIIGVYVGAIFGHLAVAINRQKETIWVYLSGAAITLIGYLVFIPRFGMFGAAWMSVFSELYVGVFLWLTVRKYVGETLQLKTVGKIFLSTITMGITLFIFRSQSVFILIPLGAVVYGIVLFAVGGVSRATIKEITALKINNTSDIENRV